MSQQELEHGDQEVMGVVNGHSHPEATATAENIAEAAQQGRRIATPPAAPRNDKTVYCCESFGAKHTEGSSGAEAKRQILWTVLQVMCCILVAALFVAAMLDPGFVVYLVNVGVLTSGIVAALIVDRRLRRRR